MAISPVNDFTERQALARMRIRRRRLLKMKAPTNLVLNTTPAHRPGRAGELAMRDMASWDLAGFGGACTAIRRSGRRDHDRCRNGGDREPCDGTVTEVGSRNWRTRTSTTSPRRCGRPGERDHQGPVPMTSRPRPSARCRTAR